VGSFAAMMQLEKQREKEVADQQRKHEEGEWKERFEKMTATGRAALSPPRSCATFRRLW
jgi:hypothetical protein